MHKKKIISQYAQFQANSPKVHDERSLKIIEKGKVFGVEIFFNEFLAKELLSLEFENDIGKEHIEALLKIYDISDNAVEKAQQSI